MNKGKLSGTHVGGAMILVIFVVLCLVIFGVLSLVTSNTDLRLSQKSADAVAAYYAADTAAEEKLALLDAAAQAARKDAQALAATGEYDRNVYGALADDHGDWLASAAVREAALQDGSLGSYLAVVRLRGVDGVEATTPAQGAAAQAAFSVKMGEARLAAAIDFPCAPGETGYVIASWKIVHGDLVSYEPPPFDLVDIQ